MPTEDLYIETELEKNYFKTISRTIYFALKRGFDIFVSLFGLVFLLPLTLIVKICYLLTNDKTPIIYKQIRIGKNGKEFALYKFRSMVPNAEQILEEWLNSDEKRREEYLKNRKFDDDPRITKMGKILRSTSLDELPQLLNILKGDMSFIGPRPVLYDGVQTYKDQKELLVSIRPGLTGYWACNGRSCTTYEKRQELELYYVKHCSILLDIKIIFLTIIRVFQGNGAK